MRKKLVILVVLLNVTLLIMPQVVQGHVSSKLIYNDVGAGTQTGNWNIQGQTFTVPAGGIVITSFEFSVKTQSAVSNFAYTYYVTNASGGKPTGAPLFSGSGTYIAGAELVQNWKTYTVTGGVYLPAGVYAIMQGGQAVPQKYYFNFYEAGYAGGGSFVAVEQGAYGDVISWSVAGAADDKLFRVYGYVPSAPTVSTEPVTSIELIAATGNGTVADDGGLAVTERGIVWKTTVNPTITDSKSAVAGTTGVFTAPITGLTVSTLYHARAYATNIIGTAYGADVTFTSLTPSTLAHDTAGFIPVVFVLLGIAAICMGIIAMVNGAGIDIMILGITIGIMSIIGAAILQGMA